MKPQEQATKTDLTHIPFPMDPALMHFCQDRTTHKALNTAAHSDRFASVDTSKLYSQVELALGELYDRAFAGDIDAAKHILSTAKFGASYLKDLSSSHLKVMKSIAATTPTWPVLTSQHPLDARLTKQYLNTLDVGRDCDLAVLGTKVRWNREKLATQIALDLIEVIRANCAFLQSVEIAVAGGSWPSDARSKLRPWVLACENLPPLNKSTALVWWNIARVAFKESVPEPGKYKELMRLVLSEERISKGNYAWFESELKEKIVDKIRVAFMAIPKK